MKKCLLFLWLCLLTICLFAQNGTRNNIQNSSAERLTHVSAAQALEVGYTFMRTNGHDRGNGNVRKQAMQLVYTGVVTDSLTRTVTDCYYVFALQPTGFVMVSADERVNPILGYSYSNDFVVEDMPDNILFWLDNYKKQIKAVVDNGYPADQTTSTSWSLLKSGQSVAFRSGTSVNPLLQTTWNQNCYYNQLCPEDAAGPCGHAYAGCVATAMAQVMHYWGWPTQGFNSHSYTCDYGTLSVDFSTATYNHGNMPNALTYSTSASQKEEVAKFIYHCGVAVDMGYGADGSGAYSSDVPSALYNYFAYTDNGTYRSKSNYSESGWANLIKQELNNMRPVYYAGHGTGGHAFVCDGYDENNLFHFNWGWSGSNDGYFELSTLNPSSYNFSESQAAVTGVTAGTFIRCSESELSFSARVGEQSSAKSITVCAHGLSGSISVAVGNGFKVSKNGILYYTSLTLPASGGTLYVKYVPTQSGDVLDSLTLTSGSCSARVYLNGTDNVIVGDGPATSIYLPSHSYYKYALTQQIYTPAEIGTSGYIRSIAFYNSGTEKTRNYDMYLVLTDKDTFANGTDWIAVSEDDKVFSGEVTMAEGTWTTFQIDSFAYDGVSNLALIMDDNTGSYSSGMACKVFSAENRTLRIYSDGTNYDPANPGAYTGTVEDQKNQLKIDINPSSIVICEKPKNLAFSNLTPTSVSVSWSNGSGNFGYEYKKSSETEWTVVCAGNCGFNCNLTGLTPNTSYQFRVHSICADSTTSGWLTGSFSTPAGIPLIEPFDNSTKPNGWTLYTGLLNNVMEGTATLTAATSGWTFGTGNGVFNSHARTNIYGTSWNKWLVTPTLLMEDNVQLSFDLALTKYSGNLQQPVDTLQQDDKFVVLITSDNGATWEILRQWDNTGSEYVYNHIVCSANGEFVTIDLSGYAGRNIAVAFYGESTVSGGDNNLHIDNVRIDYIPTCEAPTALTVTDVTAHTASLSWESDAIDWQICLNGDETNLINVTSDSYTFTDLIPETVYTVKVRANCIMGLQSPWSEEVSFMPTYRVVIGSGTGTNSYLPTNVNNKYSLTQQIYTVSELGEAGNIVSIDFHKNNNEECARNLDIYMVSTDKGSFAGTNDWIPVTDADKVFGGTVNFADNDWTTITLDRPFSYDGTNNIAIMVDDNSGRTVSATPFLAFPAGNQSLRICGRTTNYRATTGSYTGTIELSKNQIRIMKVDYALICDAPADLTVSEIDHQGATVNWNGEADSWIVACRPANAELFTEVNVNTTSYTLTGLDASTNYTVKVAAKCGNETVWGEEVNFTTLSAPCPAIVLDNNATYVENFDNYTPSTTAATGVEPDCWEVINEDVALTEATKPQVYYNANFATSGNYTLRMKNRCVYAMPELSENIDLTALTMTFNLRQPKTAYRLQVGVINAEGEFEKVKEINNSGVEMEEVTVDFSGYNGNGHRIAFRNSVSKSSTLEYSINYIDDIVLSYNTLSCGMTLPYTENFDRVTSLTVAETGAQPDCWEVFTEDVALNDITKPQAYYNASYATSGSYTLRMKNRCTYAMPALSPNVPVSDLTMTFNLRQPNSKYRLQVGVLNDEGEFTLVKTFKCSGTSMQSFTVDFSNYTGTGHRIAFRNTLVPGTGMSTTYLDYSVNYIDDINIGYTEVDKSVANNDAVLGENDLDVVVYPNPTKDVVNVQCTMNNAQCSGIEIVDVYGKIITTVDQTTTRIDVSGLAAGMYFVRVTTDRGVVTKPFVKR